MTLDAYLTQYVTSSSGVTGYLAQHDLLRQIPELASDAPSPRRCLMGTGEVSCLSFFSTLNFRILISEVAIYVLCVSDNFYFYIKLVHLIIIRLVVRLINKGCLFC